MSPGLTHQIRENPELRLAVGAALRAVQVNAYVVAVGDLQPEALPWISGPPGVDTACLVSLYGWPDRRAGCAAVTSGSGWRPAG